MVSWTTVTVIYHCYLSRFHQIERLNNSVLVSYRGWESGGDLADRLLCRDSESAIA